MAAAITPAHVTGTMLDAPSSYPRAVYPLDSTENPLSGVLINIGLYASNIGRCGEQACTGAGTTAITWTNAMADASYYVDVWAQTAGGINTEVSAVMSSRAVTTFNVKHGETCTVYWSIRKYLA